VVEARGRWLPAMSSPLLAGGACAASARSEAGQSVIKTDAKSLPVARSGFTCKSLAGDHANCLGITDPSRHSGRCDQFALLLGGYAAG
jgi:hypothetical protein